MLNLEAEHGIYIERKIRAPHFSMTTEHMHHYYEIFYLKEGLCTYRVNNRNYLLKAGDFFFIKAGDLHYTTYDSDIPTERLLISCSLTSIPQYVLKRYPSLTELFSSSCKVVLKGSGQREQAEYLLSRMMEENNRFDEYCLELMRLLLTELLLLLRRSGSFVHESLPEKETRSADIDAVITYIDQNFPHPITLEDVAERSNLSPAWLSRKFKSVTGITFKEYLNNVRIRQAAQDLLLTEHSITRVALDCGFNSSNYFKDIFRKTHGLSPRDYRKKCQRMHITAPD